MHTAATTYHVLFRNSLQRTRPLRCMRCRLGCITSRPRSANPPLSWPTRTYSLTAATTGRARKDKAEQEGTLSMQEAKQRKHAEQRTHSQSRFDPRRESDLHLPLRSFVFLRAPFVSSVVSAFSPRSLGGE